MKLFVYPFIVRTNEEEVVGGMGAAFDSVREPLEFRTAKDVVNPEEWDFWIQRLTGISYHYYIFSEDGGVIWGKTAATAAFSEFLEQIKRLLCRDPSIPEGVREKFHWATVEVVRELPLDHRGEAVIQMPFLPHAESESPPTQVIPTDDESLFPPHLVKRLADFLATLSPG